MTTHDKLIEVTHAEEPVRQLLERLGWTHVPREVLAAEHGLAVLPGHLRVPAATRGGS